MKSLKKKWSLQGSNQGHDGVARQESFKSELATAGAVIHPITYVNSVKYILKQIFEFRKRAHHLLLPPIFQQPWIVHFVMKLHDVNMKVDRFLTRNMMMVI